MWNQSAWVYSTLIAVICLLVAQGAPLDDAEIELEAMQVKVDGINKILENSLPETDPLDTELDLEGAKAKLQDVYDELSGIDFTLVTAENVNLIKEKTETLETIRNLLETNQDIVTDIIAEDSDSPDAFRSKLALIEEKIQVSIALIHRLNENSIPELPLNSPFFISFISVGALCVLLILFGFVCICIINSGSLIKKVKPKNKVGKAKKLKKNKSSEKNLIEDLWIEPNPNGPYRRELERQISMPGGGSYPISEPQYNQYSQPEPMHHNMIDVGTNHYLDKNRQIIVERGYGRRPDVANSNLHY